MFQTIINAWKIADLRKKLLYTALVLLIFRIGAALPVPFVDIAENGIIADPNANNFMTYLSMMTGDAFNYGTLFAMSITPYINASIIIQLLTVAIPPLERLAKEGEEGRKKISTITRFTAVALAALQSTAYFFYIRSQGYLTAGTDGAALTGFFAVFQALVIILCYTAGAALLMWLGEQINDKGIGNGISIILFAGIVSRMPTTLYSLYTYINRGGAYFALIPIAFVCMILMIAYIVWMDNAERRIPVQYAKRVVGRKMYGGQSTHIPIKVAMSGVMPIIFASSILSIPSTIEMFLGENAKEGFWGAFFSALSPTGLLYGVLYFFLIIMFAYFYLTIQYNPIEMANNLRQNNGTIPGIRPGKPTSDFITRTLNKITMVGALFLAAVAVLPIILGNLTGMSIQLGGTSMLIVVGVALDTTRSLDSFMMMRNHKGFLG